MADVVVIGAGMTGLTAAHELRGRGHTAIVLDKGRRPGGRMATRRIGDAVFDHGAQHFSARSETFRSRVQTWKEAGTVGVWLRTQSVTKPERGIEPRFVGVGGMRRLPEELAAGLDVRSGVTVDRLTTVGDRVVAISAGTVVATGAAAIVTPPGPQTLALLERSEIDPGPIGAQLAEVGYDATLAVMATLAGPSGLPDGHMAAPSGAIAWMADNQHKGASPVPAVTIHSSAAFAADHLEAPYDEWVRELTVAAGTILDAEIVAATGHRWRYSMPHTALDIGAALLAGVMPIVLAGEVFAGARVEGAFTSGSAAAALVTAAL